MSNGSIVRYLNVEDLNHRNQKNVSVPFCPKDVVDSWKREFKELMEFNVVDFQTLDKSDKDEMVRRNAEAILADKGTLGAKQFEQELLERVRQETGSTEMLFDNVRSQVLLSLRKLIGGGLLPEWIRPSRRDRMQRSRSEGAQVQTRAIDERFRRYDDGDDDDEHEWLLGSAIAERFRRYDASLYDASLCEGTPF